MESDWTESSRKWLRSGWLNRSIKFSGYVCAQPYRGGGDFAFIPFFVAAHCFSSLQLEQILLHNWVCHCVWMGSSHGSNERASLCARFSELSSRELNFWATHHEGMGSPFVGVTAVTLIDCCWKCENENACAWWLSGDKTQTPDFVVTQIPT